MRATQGVTAQMSQAYYVYILASRRNGTLYVGVTNDLMRRIEEHRQGEALSFTRKHGVKILVYCEQFGDVTTAIAREKRMKKYKREWKINLIEQHNPNWQDLVPDFAG
jgi:putative endonuclease